MASQHLIKMDRLDEVCLEARIQGSAYTESSTMQTSQRTEFKWKLTFNVMNDLRLRDQCAFISISRSMITSPLESILRRLYWKVDRKTTRLHSLPSDQSNDQE